MAASPAWARHRMLLTAEHDAEPVLFDSDEVGRSPPVLIWDDTGLARSCDGDRPIAFAVIVAPAKRGQAHNMPFSSSR